MSYRRRLRKESPHAFERVNVGVQGMDAAQHHSALTGYLASANLRLDALEGSQALRAQVTRFPHLTFGHAFLPQATVVWPRDRLSLDSCGIVICSAGGIEVDSCAPVLRREPGLVLIPPGTEHVAFRTLAPANEVLYVTASALLVRGLDLSVVPSAADPVPDGILAPLHAFAVTICSISLEETSRIAPLEAAATDVARALAEVMVDGATAAPTLFAQAMQVIVRDHAQQRLNAGSLARTLGRSERTLQAAFAAEGTTPTRELRATRARAAHELRRRTPHATADEISRIVGFGSASSMTRALREFAADLETRTP